MKRVVVFGGGVSGLTAAHELLDKGFDVTIIEKSDHFGGMVSSKIVDSTPTEHSWRAYGPFYNNFDELAKRIPVGNKTVYDMLSPRHVNFSSPKDELTNDDYNPKRSLTDLLILGYSVGKVLLSNKRREVYKDEVFKSAVSDYLTQGGKDSVLAQIGPGIGLDVERTATYHISKFIELYMHTKNRKYWNVMGGPTSMVWIDPWVSFLKSKGLKTIRGELTNINISNDRIVNCYYGIKSLSKEITADYYVFAINPYNMQTVIRRNKNLLKDKELGKFRLLTAEEPHKQISFTIVFEKSIKLLHPDTCLVFTDSEFNITLYPQEHFWNHYELPSGKGIWSGTACITTVPGKLYNLPANKCTKEQFINEILFQIFRSKELRRMISSQSTKIEEVRVWDEWVFRNQTVNSIAPKWVNTTYNWRYRPNQKTSFKNMMLAGAHTNTTIDIWSMCGAVESGKIAAKLICEDNGIAPPYLYSFNTPLLLKLFHPFDDLLYLLGLPNILVFIVILVILVVGFIIFKLLKK
jgi:hypothetical protein